MIIPRFAGADVVRSTPRLANANGFIEVDAGYQHVNFADVYAVGFASTIVSGGATPIASGVPTVGFPSEQMAKTAAHNIAARIDGMEKRLLTAEEIAVNCLLDEGNLSLITAGDSMIGSRGDASGSALISQLAKQKLERRFLEERGSGRV
jgi:sulfide:quinone oxidoreductase